MAEPAIVANLLAGLPKPADGELYGSGFSVAPVTPELLDAWQREGATVRRNRRD